MKTIPLLPAVSFALSKKTPTPASSATTLPGRRLRLAQLLALAIEFEGLVRQGLSTAVLARWGQVSRARLSQVLNLVLLAPDLQEAILFWPATPRGRDPLTLRHLLPLTRLLSWPKQRCRWRQLTRQLQRRGLASSPGSQAQGNRRSLDDHLSTPQEP